MKQPRPSLARLRALQAVCRTGSFSEAAHRLLLTQPAVSAQIRQLEEETGVPLVERVGKSARATPEGARLIACADRIFHDLDGTLQELAGMRGEVTGRLLIGAGGTATTYLLPDILADLERTHPKLEIGVLTGNTPDLARRLIDASLDIAVLTAPIPDERLAEAPFYRDRLVCIAAAGEAVGRPSIRRRDLAGRRLVLFERGGTIRNAVDGWLKPERGDAPAVLEIGSAEAQKSFVRAGFGWSIISEMSVAREAAEGLLQVLPLSPPLSRRLVTVWRRDRATNPAIRAARETLGRFAA